MKLGLGIDTGGTYTDAVIYDFNTKEILSKAKALTTKQNLAEGIIQSLSNLQQSQFSDVHLISLSTTLATNACVEGKRARGKLILIGYDAQLLTALRTRYGLPEISQMILIPGGHGQQGQVLSEPDWDLLEKSIRESDSTTDAYGVAEYWGIRNPEFEQEAKAKIRKWTGKPVVCANELSSEINSLRRASTTLLNAGLIKLIDELLDAVKTGMTQMGISAPVMIVRGDGTMMSESFARERPVETLLSGPAASVVGGMELTDTRDALILDIGGTTSDLALVRNGLTVLSEEGVDVGDWRTGTKAIKIQTIGLGGDSIITFDKNDNLTIGPRKAAPLSWLAAHYPAVKQELLRIRDMNKWHSLSLGEFFYMINKPKEVSGLNPEERSILDALEKGPRSLEQLSWLTNTSMFSLKTEYLEQQGIIGRSALTPSDLMHIKGDYEVWDRESAHLGGEIMANRLKISMDALIDKVYTLITKKLYHLIVGFLLEGKAGKGAHPLINMAFEKPMDQIQIQVTTPLPIVGIGAPAHIFLDRLAAYLGTNALLNNHSGVANAVGAITGSIVGEEVVLVKPRYDNSGIIGFGCHGSSAYADIEDYEEALEWAKATAEEVARQKAGAMGAANINVDVSIQDNWFRENEVELMLETLVVAKAIGNQSIF